MRLKKASNNAGLTGQQGYTLVELMISLTISLIALGILGRAFVSQKKTFDEQRQVVEMQQNVKIGMHLMVSELSFAGYLPESEIDSLRPTSDNIQGISAITMDSITFQGDIDGDNKTEKIKYSLDGDELKRRTWEWDGAAWGSDSGEQSFVSDAQAFTISYMLAGDPDSYSTTADNIRKINIQLHVVAKKGDGTVFRFQILSSDVVPRNLGL